MISGKTRFVPILAHPCAHVRTPPLFNAECQRQGVDMIMVPLDVRPDMLASTVQSLRAISNVAGMVLTIPHKGAIAALCDRLAGAGELVGACNIVRRDTDGSLTGNMFDGEGFVAGLRHEGHEPSGKTVLLVGAGGAASGIAHALLKSGVARLAISNRSAEKAQTLAGRLQGLFPSAHVEAVIADTLHYDLVINSTSLGMHVNDGLPIDVEKLRPGTVVAEVVMQPDVTALLVEAQARGCIVHKGVHMVNQQVRLLVDFLK